MARRIHVAGQIIKWNFLRAKIVERMMFHDLLAYLPDDILTKVDRAAMSVSLETRVPFLDHELVEFALKSVAQKNPQWARKMVVEASIIQICAKIFFERPKQGFSFPLDCWLRGPYVSGQRLCSTRNCLEIKTF